MDLLKADFTEIVDSVKSKKISAQEVTQFYLDRISKLDNKLNSYTFINQQAIIEAKAIDEKISKGHEVGSLAGVVFGIKDLVCTKGMPSTTGSKMLQGFIPPYDATLVARLKKEGAIILGKLNQDEFAMGSSNETSFYGPCKNPWNPEYVPGGSSGGSAAAQAARLAMGTIGTDTGGSIRQPSSFCGVVGVKPTYGRVSRYGVIAYASSLDQAGPICSNVKDAAKTLEIICGHDHFDGTSSEKMVEKFSLNLNQNLKGKKIGIIKEYIEGIDHSDVRQNIEKAIDLVKSLGAEIVEVSISLTEYAVPVYYIISASEASSNFARYDGVRYGHQAKMEDYSKTTLDDFYIKNRTEGFGAEVKRRLMLGTYCLSSGYVDAFYIKASKVRRMLQNQFKEAFDKCDVLISPVTTSPAFRLGEKQTDPVRMYFNDIFTTSANLCGLPGMSVPFGFSQEGLPIGVQLTAPHFCEQEMLNVAYAVEKARSSDLQGKVPHVY